MRGRTSQTLHLQKKKEKISFYLPMYFQTCIVSIRKLLNYINIIRKVFRVFEKVTLNVYNIEVLKDLVKPVLTLSANPYKQYKAHGKGK